MDEIGVPLMNPCPRYVTVAGMEREESLEHPPKARLHMYFRPLGRETEVISLA